MNTYAHGSGRKDRARHSVRAVPGLPTSGGQRTARPAAPTSVSPQGFELRREAMRHAALEGMRAIKSGVAAALFHRAPGRCRAGIALLPLLFLLLAPLLSSGQTNDAISREVSVFNSGLPSAATISTNVEAISREVSVFNSGLPSPTTISTNLEAISREVSVFNSGLPSAATISTNVEAISREVSVFNSGLPSATTISTNVEAISRELSILNYGAPPVVFAIGSTNALGDETNQVPFALQTVLDLTSLSLTVQTDDSHLHILGVTPGSPEVVSIVLGTANSNGLPIAFTLNPAAIPTTNHVLAWLNFQGITNLDSAVVPLTITQFTAARSSGQVVPAATANGQVTLIVSKPILVVSANPQFGITMYGLPGATYAIEATTNLAPADWHELGRLLESGRVLALTGLTNNAAPQQFYRTEQVGP